MKNIIQIAIAELGVKEIKGDLDSKTIVNYAQELGFTNIKDDETPWCSIFINWCCLKAGLQRTHKANARSWLTVGEKVSNPLPGDIVVFWREKPSSWKGHVGIFMGYSANGEDVFTLGGNQNNSVSIQAYDADKVLSFQRLSTEKNITIPKPILKYNDRGEEVIKLQTVLNELKYYCGTADGIFGKRTEQKLIAFQFDNQLKADGIYGKLSHDLIENIFQQ